jgi:hypothetical protein
MLNRRREGGGWDIEQKRVAEVQKCFDRYPPIIYNDNKYKDNNNN